MMKAMKVGIIGVGGFAGNTHVPNVAANPAFELVALCDLNELRLNELAKQYKPRYTTTDMARVFRDPDIEMIICGTKPDVRLPIMQAAVENRKHLFVEKPLCYREKDIAVMVPLMRQAPIKFMVGFNRPYSPMMQALKPVYRKHRRGNTTIIYRIVGEAQIWPAHHYDAIIKRKESTIIHEITHIFDLLNWLTDSQPTRVYMAGGGHIDNVITLSFPQDVTAVIVAGDNGSCGFPKERIEINTNYATIVGDNFVELCTTGIEDNACRQTFPYKQAGRSFNDGARASADRLWDWRRSVTPEERAKGYYYDRQVKVDKGHYNELDCFRQMIQNDQPSQTDVICGAQAELIAWAAIKSWKSEKPVKMNYACLAPL